MATTKKQTKRRSPSHALFWTLLKETEGYDERYKEVIKEGLVHKYSGGKTCSLSEMYAKYPREYCLMIEAMKGTPEQKRDRYDKEQENARRRVLGVLCKHLDKIGYKFDTPEDKLDYAKRIACNAAPCARFNAIPLVRLQAIYNGWSKKNEVDIAGNPELDFPPGIN